MTIRKLFKLTASAFCLIGTVSCSNSQKTVYSEDNDSKITLTEDRTNIDKDKLMLFHDSKDIMLIIGYKGHFNKDSVDAAVEEYTRSGKIPLMKDLN